jgi:4-amino-4-deoxy-L-arabinose transferase-like glycosyltransferase
VAITAAFVLVTVWWLTQDRRVPVFDPGLHEGFAFYFHDQMAAGHPFVWFDYWTQYPPLVHLIGAIATFIAGKNVWPGVMAQNLVFVPLLSLGCYGTAKLVYRNELAGLLAVAFALGTPMIVSQFHVFMVDAPETAMVAVSVWLLLASRGFERVGTSALAGVAVGLGLMTKESFVAFVAGVVVVTLVRGARGWRTNWRGLAAFAALVLVIAAPWYIHHWSDVQHLRRLTSADGFSDAPGSNYPHRYSTKNAGWFLWSGLNYQNLAPLLAFSAVGVTTAVVRLVRRRAEPLTIDLMVGGLVAWAGFTYSLPHDPRYSLPALVFLAAFGAGWITLLHGRARIVGAAALGAVVFVNFVAVNTGLGWHRLSIKLPGAPTASFLHERELTLYSDLGYVYGKPIKSGDLLGVMRHLHHEGARKIRWDFGAANTGPFNNEGLAAFAQMAHLALDQTTAPPGPDVAYLLLSSPVPGRQPCRHLPEHIDVWVTLGDPKGPDPCPR